MNTTLEFLGIDNIHAIRNSFQRLRSVISSRSTSESMMWLKHIEDTNWLYYIRMVLLGSVRVAHAMLVENKSVLIHCSDGWDRTSQVSSLAQLLLDPYYRTYEGFFVLVRLHS